MPWHADSVQAVLFTSPEAQRDALSLWASVFPSGPDSFQKAVASPNLMSTASGERDGFAVGITAQTGRVDINLGAIFSAIPGLQQPSSRPPRIENVAAAAERLADYVKAALGPLKVIRAAIVLDLAKTVQAGEERAALQGIFPTAFFPKNCTDVVYQFNSRKSFGATSDLEMNRLCTWATGEVALFSAPNIGVQFGGAFHSSKFIGWKIDVNTAPDSRPPSSLMPVVVEELKNEALAIYAGGYEYFDG